MPPIIAIGRESKDHLNEIIFFEQLADLGDIPHDSEMPIELACSSKMYRFLRIYIKDVDGRGPVRKDEPRDWHHTKQIALGHVDNPLHATESGLRKMHCNKLIIVIALAALGVPANAQNSPPVDFKKNFDAVICKGTTDVLWEGPEASGAGSLRPKSQQLTIRIASADDGWDLSEGPQFHVTGWSHDRFGVLGHGRDLGALDDW